MNWYKTVISDVDEKDLGMIRDFAGIAVHVENTAGTERIGVDPDGHEWRIKMKYDYGFIYSQKGEDDEGLDVYLGPDQEAENVFVVHQVDPYDNHKPDEDKCMMGFGSPEDAKKAYQEHYDRDDYFGTMTEIPFEEFKEIVNSKKRDKVNWKRKGEKVSSSNRKYAQQEPLNLEIVPECTGAHNGQVDCVLKAYLGDRIIGYLSYVEFQGKTFIQHIEVAEDMRRQGIATALFQKLQDEAQGEIQHTMQTPDGAAWRKSLEASQKYAKQEFYLNDEIRQLWKTLLKEEQGRVDIKFDLENDESVAIREIDVDGPDNHYKTKILAELYAAGGDWQCPTYYFRCQEKYKFNEDSGSFSHGVKFIIIPEKNSDLVKDDDGSFSPRDNGGSKDCNHGNEKEMWDQLPKLVKERLKQYYDQYSQSDGDTGYDTTGVVRDLTNTYGRKSSSSNWYRMAQIEPDKVLYLVRGISGSGKSTMAKELAGETGSTYESDDFFMVNDKYEFDRDFLEDAHFWNETRVYEAMERGETPIVVPNTMTQAWEPRKYVEMAQENGYRVEIKEPDTPWKFDAEELAKRNTHKVPREVIDNMINKWEKDITVDDILKAKRPDNNELV